MSAVHEVDGYGIVIPHVQNVYPVEETPAGWQYGFKYVTGIFEYFQCATKEEAEAGRSALIGAVENFYWLQRNPEMRGRA